MPPTRNSQSHQRREVQASKKRTYRRRRIIVGIAVLVVLAVGFYLPMTLLAPLKAAASTTAAYTAPTSASATVPLPDYGASAISALGYNGVFASGGKTTPQPIASISKLVTTLIVLQKKPLAVGAAGPAITFTSADATYLSQYEAQDGSVEPIQVGAKLSERDVIEVALIPSADNYARALADWAFGSQAKFATVARAWLKTQGMTQTTIDEPTGINPANASTPHDLLILAKLALANPIISQITSMKQATLPVVGLVANTNLLLGVDGIVGLKTGTLITAGASLLFAARATIDNTPITLVGVVLDGPTHPIINEVIQGMVKRAFKGFHTVTLTASGQSFGSYTTEWGTTASASASKSASELVWGASQVTEHTSLNSVTFDTKGATVGSATFTVTGGLSSATITVPLTLSATLKDPGAGWRISHPAQLL